MQHPKNIIAKILCKSGYILTEKEVTNNKQHAEALHLGIPTK